MAIIPPLPFTLTNGTTADATKVMADLLSMFTSVNNYAAPLANAYLDDPQFTNPVSTGGTFTGMSVIGGTIGTTTTGVTQSPLTDNTIMATTEYVDYAVAHGAGGPAAAGTLTGATLAANVVNTSITSTGTLTSLEVSGLVLLDGNFTVLGHSSLDSGHITTNGSGTITAAALGTAVTGVTQSPNDNSTKIATTAYVDATAGGGSGLGTVFATNSTNGVITLTLPANSVALYAFCTATVLPSSTLNIGGYVVGPNTPTGMFTIGTGTRYDHLNNFTFMQMANPGGTAPEFPLSSSPQTINFINDNGFPNWSSATINIGIVYITV